MIDTGKGPLKVFVAEHIPLENKGEEAILRGIQDLLGGQEQVSIFCLNANISNAIKSEDIIVYPESWLYDKWQSTSGSLIKGQYVKFLIQSFRRFLNLVFPWWVYLPLISPIISSILPKRKMVLAALAEADLVIVGHDGIFSNQSCHIIDLTKRMGKKSGILGCGLSIKPRNRQVWKLYSNCFEQADFCYFREEESFLWSSSLIKSNFKLKLAPDPAFCMRPSDSQSISELISSFKGGTNKPLVALTVVENDIILKWGFKNEKNQINKREKHYKLIAKLIDHIIASWGAKVVFVPHCTGPGNENDDRFVARQIAERVKQPADNLLILEDEYSARHLKALIGQCDLLIGERIHSLIGAVSMGVPILCLGVQEDRRAIEIIGKMCRLEEAIFYLNNPDDKNLIEIADRCWEKRIKETDNRMTLAEKFRKELDEVKKEILNVMGKKDVE